MGEALLLKSLERWTWKGEEGQGGQKGAIVAKGGPGAISLCKVARAKENNACILSPLQLIHNSARS